MGTVRCWTRSGELSSGSPICAGVACSDVVTRDGAVSTSFVRLWRARGAGDAAVLKGEHCDAHLAGFAGRHGEEQRAPGRRRGTRPPLGALRQARQVDCHARETSSNLSDLASSFVPHARLISLHPSLVSENSCASHGVGGMNSCGSMHGVVMHENSFGVHANSLDALGTRIHVIYMQLEFMCCCGGLSFLS